MATLHELLVEAVMNMSKVKRLRSLVYAQGASNLQKEHVAVDVFFYLFFIFSQRPAQYLTNFHHTVSFQAKVCQSAVDQTTSG